MLVCTDPISPVHFECILENPKGPVDSSPISCSQVKRTSHRARLILEMTKPKRAFREKIILEMTKQAFAFGREFVYPISINFYFFLEKYILFV